MVLQQVVKPFKYFSVPFIIIHIHIINEKMWTQTINWDSIKTFSASMRRNEGSDSLSRRKKRHEESEASAFDRTRLRCSSFTFSAWQTKKRSGWTVTQIAFLTNYLADMAVRGELASAHPGQERLRSRWRLIMIMDWSIHDSNAVWCRDDEPIV